MKSWRIIFLGRAVADGAGTGLAQTTNFLAWTFDNLAIAVNNAPSPSLGTGTATPLGMSNSYNGTRASPRRMCCRIPAVRPERRDPMPGACGG